MRNVIGFSLIILMLFSMRPTVQAGQTIYVFAYREKDVLSFSIHLYGENDTLESTSFDGDETVTFRNNTVLEVIFLSQNNTDDVPNAIVTYDNISIDNYHYHNPFGGIFALFALPFYSDHDGNITYFRDEILDENGTDTGVQVDNLGDGTWGLALPNLLLPISYYFIFSPDNGTVLSSQNRLHDGNQTTVYLEVNYLGFEHRDDLVFVPIVETETRTRTGWDTTTQTHILTVTDVKTTTPRVDARLSVPWLLFVTISLAISSRRKKNSPDPMM